MTAVAATSIVRNVRPLGGDLRDIAVSDGRIAAIAAPGALASSGAAELDAEGRVATPGVIDTHVHLGNGPHSIVDDLGTETRMAATGGVTTLFTYLISPDGYDDLLPELGAHVAARSAVDVLPQLGIVAAEQIDDVARLNAQFGIRVFKCFMGYKGKDASPSGIRGIDDASIVRLMGVVAGLDGGRLAIHAENMELLDAARAVEEARDPAGSLGAWNRSRPRLAEVEAVARAVEFARATGCAITIPHLTVGADVDRLRRTAEGVDVVFETCPHYLVFSAEEERLGVWGKVNPPLRLDADRRALRAAVAGGGIDVLGSDHCPFDPPTKLLDAGIWGARSGIPNGSALLLPSAISVVPRDGAGWERIAALVAANAATRYGLPAKGRLAVGADADLAIVDPEHHAAFESARLGGVATASPYDARSFPAVWATIARGEVLQLDGEVRERATPARMLR